MSQKRSFGWVLFWVSISTICGALCFWQVQRYAWKQEIFLQVSKSQAADPVDIIQVLQNPAYFEFFPLQAKGVWEKQDFFVIGKMRQGTLGYHHLKILTLPTKHHLLVNLGWVSSKEQTLKNGPVQIRGHIRMAEPRRWGMASHNPQKQEWGTIELEAISTFSHMPLLPFYLEQGGGLQPLPVLPPERHLGYAITWFCLAVIALGIAWKGKKRSPL